MQKSKYRNKLFSCKNTKRANLKIEINCFEVPPVSFIDSSPHDEHRSSGLRSVKFVRTSKFFSFYLDIYKINSRIWFRPVTSNFHFEEWDRFDVSFIDKFDMSFIDRFDMSFIDRFDMSFIDRYDVSFIDRFDMSFIDRFDMSFIDRFDCILYIPPYPFPSPHQSLVLTSVW